VDILSAQQVIVDASALLGSMVNYVRYLIFVKLDLIAELVYLVFQLAQLVIALVFVRLATLEKTVTLRMHARLDMQEILV